MYTVPRSHLGNVSKIRATHGDIYLRVIIPSMHELNPELLGALVGRKVPLESLIDTSVVAQHPTVRQTVRTVCLCP